MFVWIHEEIISRICLLNRLTPMLPSLQLHQWETYSITVKPSQQQNPMKQYKSWGTIRLSTMAEFNLISSNAYRHQDIRHSEKHFYKSRESRKHHINRSSYKKKTVLQKDSAQNQQSDNRARFRFPSKQSKIYSHNNLFIGINTVLLHIHRIQVLLWSVQP